MYEIITILIISFVISILTSFLVVRYSKKLALIDIPNERSSHSSPTPKGGGLGILLAFTLLQIFVLKSPISLLSITFVGILGFFEDKFGLSIILRLILQFLAAIVFILATMGLPNSALQIIVYFFMIFYLVGTSNFYNFMDGINGISALNGIVSFGLLGGFAFFIQNNVAITLISLVILASLTGFLFFNIPKAKLFLGDVGSLFLGFLFAACVIILSNSISCFICLSSFLLLFYADVLLTIFYRWQNSENLLQAHRKHFYQYLANIKNIPHTTISLMYATVQLLIGLIIIYAYTKSALWVIYLTIANILLIITLCTFFINPFKKIIIGKRNKS